MSGDGDRISLTVTREDLARLIAEAEGYDPDGLEQPLQMPGDAPGRREPAPAWRLRGLPLADAIFDVLLNRSPPSIGH